MLKKKIASSKSVTLLRLTIHKKQIFYILISNFQSATLLFLKGLGRIGSNLSISHAKVLCNMFTLCQFRYCCLTWMCYKKKPTKKINQIQKQALCLVSTCWTRQKYHRLYKKYHNSTDKMKESTIHEPDFHSIKLLPTQNKGRSLYVKNSMLKT